MLTRIIVRGFQSHLDTDIVLDKGINLIRGDNASGKSALRRAILWALTNKPTGTSFINWTLEDADVCEVIIHYNGHTVARRRSRNGKVNEYVVDGAEPLTGFGVGVPDPVKDVLDLDDSNIELQHSSLFMLSESPPEMARRLNKITNLEDIDKAFTKVRRRKLENSKEVKSLEAQLADADMQLEKYDFLSEAGKIATKLEELYASTLETEKSLNDVDSMILSLEEEYQRIKPSSPVDMYAATCILDGEKKWRELYMEVSDFCTTLNALNTLPVPKGITKADMQSKRDELIRLGMEVKPLNQLIDDMQSLGMLKISPISSKEISMAKLSGILDEYSEVQLLMTNMDGVVDKLVQNVVSLNKLKKEYDEIRPQTCPLCGGPYGGNDENCNVS